jgi:ABC-type glycerol-3-phosphate transport system substrate-binding protein
MFSSQNQSAVAFVTEMKKGTIKTFDIRMATVPKNVDGKDTQTTTVYHNGAMMFNTGKADEMKAGKEFLSWYLKQDKYMSEFTKLSGRPATRSAYNIVANANPELKQTAVVEKYYYDHTGGVPGYNSTRDLFSKMMQSVFSDKQTSVQAASAYTIAANKIVSEYRTRSVVLNKK